MPLAAGQIRERVKSRSPQRSARRDRDTARSASQIRDRVSIDGVKTGFDTPPNRLAPLV
jgi:hypothetical protein